MKSESDDLQREVQRLRAELALEERRTEELTRVAGAAQAEAAMMRMERDQACHARERARREREDAQNQLRAEQRRRTAELLAAEPKATGRLAASEAPAGDNEETHETA